MWPYHPDLLARPVPRYTSFPTAAEFAPGITPREHAEAIERTTGEVSLYVHIPFCDKICWYCGCNTGVANRTQRLESYLDALYREVAQVASLLPAGARVGRVAFGGGSPNALAPTDFVRLVDALVLHFGLTDPVLSVELDPRNLTRAWGVVLAGTGFERASLGVQTFSARLQRVIGRVQPFDRIRRSVDLLRSAGVRTVNFDLMYGLPGQVLHDLADTLDKTIAMGANRAALFGYAHVPHMIPRQRKIDATDLPGAAGRFAMAAFGYDRLVEAGYHPVGFDHFALPGDPMAQAAMNGSLRRNFQGFTDDTAPALIGMGASAISCFPHLIVQNEKNSGRYRMVLSHTTLPTALGVRRSVEDRQAGAIIDGLLCRGEALVDQNAAVVVWSAISPYVKAGLCAYDRGRLIVLPDGLPYARSIAAAFDPYRQNAAHRFSSAV